MKRTQHRADDEVVNPEGEVPDETTQTESHGPSYDNEDEGQDEFM